MTEKEKAAFVDAFLETMETSDYNEWKRFSRMSYDEIIAIALTWHPYTPLIPRK